MWYGIACYINPSCRMHFEYQGKISVQCSKHCLLRTTELHRILGHTRYNSVLRTDGDL